jgi:hypothetical protein
MTTENTVPDASHKFSDSQSIAMALAPVADDICAFGCRRSEALQLVGQDPVKRARAVAKIDAELEALRHTATVLDDAAFTQVLEIAKRWSDQGSASDAHV